MNYRRGLQRLYLVCAVFWVAVVLILSIRNRPRTIDYDALAKEAGAIDVNPSKTITLPPDAVDVPSNSATGANRPKPGVNDRRTLKDSEVAELDKLSKSNAPLRVVKSEPLPDARLSYWIARSIVGLLPPLAIYMFLFYVLEWVCRGFRPGTQI